jgi:cyclohexanone monooxygenase
VRSAEAGADDPMIRRSWLEQALRWYRLPRVSVGQHPLETPLRGLPPMLIQVGEQEMLLPDSTRLADHARRHGVDCRIEIHARRWHVFHLQAAYLSSARRALHGIGEFARSRATIAQELTAASPRNDAERLRADA